MKLIFCNFWSANCFVIDDHVNNQLPTFAITDTKLYVLIVTLSTHKNPKLLKQLKSGFIIAVKWNKYLSKLTQYGTKLIFILLNWFNFLKNK